MADTTIPFEERYWGNIDKKASGGCWIWTGGTSMGYGGIRHNGEQKRTHRVAYELEHGSIPDDALILHKCDVRRCVNPDHLYAGDRSDNANDMWERNPPDRKAPSGEEHPNAKLTANEVREIKSLLGDRSHPEIAKRFNVSKSLIEKISRGVLWEGVV